MRLTLTVLTVFAALLIVSAAKAHVTRIPARCTTRPARLLCSTHFHAHRTNTLRLAAHAPRIIYQWYAEAHPAARPRVLALWIKRQAHAKQLLSRYQQSQGSTGGLPSAWLRAALCVHSHEGSWTDPNAPYWGGMQMDMSFQESYGSSYLREYGTADHWPVADQLRAAYRAWQSRGWTPWPVTSAMCGL